MSLSGQPIDPTQDQIALVCVAESDFSCLPTPPSTSNGTIPDMSSHGIPQPSPESSAPWPNSTYIIRSVSTGKVITFRRGKIILAPLNGHSAIRWECFERKGFVGFRDPASYMNLGVDKNGELACSTDKGLTWQFCVRHRPNGYYVLLAYDLGSLLEVGTTVEDETEKIVVFKDLGLNPYSWDFIKVENNKD